MARFSQHDPLVGADAGSVARPCRSISESACVEKPCRGRDLPEWVRAHSPARSAPSARVAGKPAALSLITAEDGERVFPRRLLTVAETASFFQVSQKTIRRMIEAGDLPVIRLGRSVRIEPEVIEKIVRQNK